MKHLLSFITFILLSLSLFAQTATSYYAKALSLHEKSPKNYKIEKHLKNAIALDSTSAKYHSLLGTYYLNKKRYSNAVISYRKALNLDLENLDYRWFLAKAILKENIRGVHDTDEGVFEGINLLKGLLQKGDSSVKIYETIVRANQYVMDDYTLRYQNYRASEADTWKDNETNASEKEHYKTIALNAYKEIRIGCEEILKMKPNNTWAKSILKYLKNPIGI